MAQQLRQLKASPVMYSVALLCTPLLLSVCALVTLLHSSFACGVLDLLWGWARYLRYRAYDSRGSNATRDKEAHMISSFYLPMIMAAITLRTLFLRAVALRVPHTSTRKRTVLLLLSGAYAAVLWAAFSSVAASCSAAAADPLRGAAHADEVTPCSLFLSLYHTTLWLTLLGLVSTVWVPTSDASLRAAEHALLRAHQASSGASARTLDQQLRQHHAGHIAYTVLQHEEDQQDAGSGKADTENENIPDDKPEVVPPTASASALLSAPFSGPSLVFLHGYGAGKSFWLLNLPAISRALPFARVYSLDLPGMGSSSHQYTLSNCRTAAQAESYFVEGLEEWRRALGLEKMILLGHSFGGLVAAAYALKYPQHVGQMILVSPVGLPVPPPLDGTGAAGGAAAAGGSSSKGPRVPAWATRFGLIPIIRWLWSQHITLSDVLHWLGPLGPFVFRWVVEHRFAHLDAATPKRRKDGTVSPAGLAVRPMSEYLYHLNSGPCPGHRGLSLLLRPGAFAVDPLLPRLVASLTVPCALLYGESDWMSQSSGEELVAALRARLVPGEVVVVPAAGHQLALESPRCFNQVVSQIVRHHQQRNAAGGDAAAEAETEAGGNQQVEGADAPGDEREADTSGEENQQTRRRGKKPSR